MGLAYHHRNRGLAKPSKAFCFSSAKLHETEKLAVREWEMMALLY